MADLDERLRGGVENPGGLQEAQGGALVAALRACFRKMAGDCDSAEFANDMFDNQKQAVAAPLLFLLFSLLILFLPFVQAGTSSRSQTHGQTFPVCCTSGQRWCCWCWALPSLSLAWAPCARKSGCLLNTVQSQSRSLGK